MILCDVNVLLGAMVERSPHHAVCRSELERLRTRPRDMALSELILAAVVRIGTNPRVATSRRDAGYGTSSSPPRASQGAP